MSRPNALTPDERQQVQALIHQLAERHPGGWDGLMREAEVPSTTAHGWRYGKEPATPRSPYLLRLLRAAGVLGEDFLLPTPLEHLETAKRAADAAVKGAHRLGRNAPGGSKPDASKR